MSCQCGSEHRQVLVGFQSTEALGRFQDAGSRPAQRHRRVAPSLHVAADTTYRAHHVLDRVGAGERAPQWHRQFEADDSQHLVEPFENAGGDTRRLLVEPAGEIAQQSLGFGGIIELQSLSQRSADIWQRWIGVRAPKVR